jgi:hypothetical protein
MKVFMVSGENNPALSFEIVETMRDGARDYSVYFRSTCTFAGRVPEQLIPLTPR